MKAHAITLLCHAANGAHMSVVRRTVAFPILPIAQQKTCASKHVDHRCASHPMGARSFVQKSLERTTKRMNELASHRALNRTSNRASGWEIDGPVEQVLSKRAVDGIEQPIISTVERTVQE